MRFILPLLACLLMFACGDTSPVSNAEAASSREAYLKQRDQLAQKSWTSEQVATAAQDVYNQKRDSLLLAYRRANRFPLAQNNFYSAKGEIEQSSLFKMLDNMPKGGLLHTHDLALGSAWLLVDMAITMPNCYVYWGEDNARYIKGQLGFFAPGKAPGGFMETASLNQLSPRFRAELYDLLSFDSRDIDQAKDIWVPFEKQFQRRLGFMHYRPAMISFFVAAFNDLAKSGVQHVELRSILSDGLYDLNHEKGYYNTDSMVVAFKQAHAISKIQNPHFTLKIIHTGLRFLPAKIVKVDLAKAYGLKKRHPDIIVGYDLVGQEDGGMPTLMHLDCCWLKQDSLANAYGVKLPLYLHDGESNWPGNDNLFDAALLNVKRIGHGLNLFRYPQVEASIKEQGICVEISPLSNQILGYVPDLRNHPGLGYFRRGIPISLNNDDPSIFAYHGLSYDFWVAAVAWGFDLNEVKKLARNSLEYSALEGDEKRTAIKRWEEKWADWEASL
ncbi:MAG: adenosine kinase [Bacteroidia bacterium]